MFVRIAAALLVLGMIGCARSGPPAPVVHGDRAAPTPTFAATPEVQVATLPAADGAVRGAPVSAVTGARLQHEDPGARTIAGRQATSQEARVRVGRGDTLYAISRRHKIPLRALIRANGLKPPFKLKLGQELRVPETRYYVVGSGDTVYRLSRRFDIPPKRIIKVNRIRTAGYKLYPGQKLLLPRPGKAQSQPRTETMVAQKLDSPQSRTNKHTKAHALAMPKNAVKAPRIVPRRKSEPAKKAAKKAPAPAKKTEFAAKKRPATVQKASIPEPPPAAKPRPRPTQTARLTRIPARAGGFVWPVDGTLLSSYGSKGGGLYNDGINIAARKGAPVRAAESGVVAYAGNELKGYGNLLLIRHEGGWVSAYAHNDRLLVKKGQVVRRGQRIAEVGQSGAVDKPQLHFELRRGPNAVDPLKHLEKSKRVRS